MGDSISSGFAAGGAKGNFESDSWTTGSVINSHFVRFRAGNPTLTKVNVAEPGAKVSQIDDQLDNATFPRVAGYVTVTTGSSEVCSSQVTQTSQMMGEQEFRDNLRLLLQKLQGKLRNTRVLLASVPNWFQVYQDFKDNPTVSQRWNAPGGNPSNPHACPLLFDNTGIATDEPNGGTRGAVLGQIRLYNSILASVCSEFPGFCAYDNGAAFAIPFTEGDLSTYDGFHPSTAGQLKIADATFPFSPGFAPHPGTTPGPTTTPTADTTPPALTVALANRLRLLRALARGIQFSVACSEAATFSAQLRIGAALANRLNLPRVVGRAAARPCSEAGRVGNRAKFTKKAKRKLAKLNAVRVSVLVKAVDQAGNRANRSRKTRLSR